MNEDFVAPGKGFGTHPHRDMEIVTYVLEGALEHRDSMGNGEVLRPGGVSADECGDRDHAQRVQSVGERARAPVPDLAAAGTKGNRAELRAEAVCGERARATDCGWLRRATRPRDRCSSIKTLASCCRQSTATGRLNMNWPRGDMRGCKYCAGRCPSMGKRFETSDGAAMSGERLVAIQAHRDAEIMLFDLA